jgi:hypothetical protein
MSVVERWPMSRKLLAPLCLVIACGPAARSPVDVMALVLNNEGAYQPKPVKLKTTSDPVALKGTAATLVGGARIVIDDKDPLLQVNGGNPTDAQLEDIFVKGKGGDPRASYIEKDGVLWPADFHTWNMVTTYFNFEVSFDYFQRIYDGKATDELLGSKVYYFPSFTSVQASPKPQNDNAAWFSPIQGFMVLPFDRLQKVPLAMNVGVIGHEYSHRVFNRRVYASKSIPDALVRWQGLTSASPQLNLLFSMDEGLADFHGYGVTCLTEFGCNAKFLAASLDENTQAARDFTRDDKCMTKGLRDAMETLALSDFKGQGDEYLAGTVLASALYQSGSKKGPQGQEVMRKAVINSYNDPDPTNPGFAQLVNLNLQRPDNFTLKAVVDILAGHVTDPELRNLFCTSATDKLQLECADLPKCGATCVKGTTCPNIVTNP